MSTSSWVRDALDGRTRSRTKVWSIIGWVGIGLCGLIALVYGVLAGGIGFPVGLLFALLPVPLLVFAVLSLDRLEPEPTRNLVLAFAWGGAVAVVIALGIEFPLGLLVKSKAFGLGVAAPFAEELAKGAIIFILLHRRKTELDGPTDGIVYAGMVGIGFAFSENIVYYGQALGQGAGSLVGTFVLRGIFSPLAHPLFTSATGVALGYAALKRDTAMRWLLPIGGLVLAMILHGTWNVSGISPFGIFGTAAYYLLIMVPVLVGCILIAFFDRRRVLRQVATYLPAYVPAGVFHRDEVSLLSTMKARRKMRRLMRDYQHAATELAMLDDHAARGTAGSEYGPRREALVRILILAKQAFPGNEGIASNLAQVEGTLPPAPLPRYQQQGYPQQGYPQQGQQPQLGHPQPGHPQAMHPGMPVGAPPPAGGYPPPGGGLPSGPRPAPPPWSLGPRPGPQGPPPGQPGQQIPPGQQAPPLGSQGQQVPQGRQGPPPGQQGQPPWQQQGQQARPPWQQGPPSGQQDQQGPRPDSQPAPPDPRSSAPDDQRPSAPAAEEPEPETQPGTPWRRPDATP